MDRLIEIIEEAEEIERGEPKNKAAAKIYSKGMVEDGFAALPEDYIELCSHFNGLWIDGAQIYAIDPSDSFLEDVLMQNDEWIHATSQQQLVLGENEMDYLVYDAADGIYFMLDKDYSKPGRRFEEFERAVAYLLNL